MRLATQNTTQLHTIFGGAYVLEQRSDESHGHLQPDAGSFVLNFSDVLRALRAALSLR
jgi:hypothetical protein